MFNWLLKDQLDKRMLNWSQGSKEIGYELTGVGFTLNPPYGKDECFTVTLQGSVFTIQLEDKVLKVQRKLFESNSKFIDRMITGIASMSKVDKIKFPNIKGYQFAMLLTNHIGQVLTTKGELFNGWGRIYHIVESIGDVFSVYAKISQLYYGPIYGHVYNGSEETVAELCLKYS